MLTKITFNEDGISTGVRIDGTVVEGDADVYDVPSSPSGKYQKDAEGNVTPYEIVANYTDSRRAEYPSVGDQLDAIWKILMDMDPTVEQDVVCEKIKVVKEKWPK